jgi:hypothetical protein
MLWRIDTSKRTATLLAVHAASGHEARCDVSFHARLHTRLPQCEAVPSALLHDVLLSASDQREDRSWGVSALVVGA